MSKEEKKTISFGFSKLQKAPIIGSKLPPKSDDAVQFIDCLENKSIKVKNEEPKKSVLVIPLNKPDSHSIVQSRIVGRQVKSKESTNDASASESSCNDLSSKTQTSTSENATENLDQLAAKEILEDLKKSQEKKEEKSTFSVPLSSAPVSEKESTLDDYDNIPITEFGLAMLRGMGWKPGKGIGKNEKLVTAKPPVLRPKGLGLGADKVIQPEKTSETKEEVLKLVKGSYIRIIAGSHKDLFGEIMGFDEETGRLIAKMAISGSVLTFNEFMVKAVNKEEYNKNSKVLNVKKYEEFKEKENAGEDPNDIIESMKNKASRSDSNVSSSRHTSDSRRRGKSDVVEDSSLHNRRDRYKESRNRSDRRRSNSHSDNDSSSRRSHAKDRRYEKRRSSSDSDSNIRRQKYSKLDRTNTESKRNWKTKENRSDSSEEDSDYEKHKHRRGKRSSSLSDEENERSKKKKYRTSHHSSEGKRKKKSRQASSSAEEEEEEDNSHRRRKNDKEDTKKVSKSVRDHKSHRVDSSYSKDKNKSKKASRKYSNSSDSSSSEEENIRSSKKNKKRHKKKHYRSRSRS